MEEVWKESGATLTQCLIRQSQLSAHISTAKRAGPQLRGGCRVGSSSVKLVISLLSDVAAVAVIRPWAPYSKSRFGNTVWLVH